MVPYKSAQFQSQMELETVLKLLDDLGSQVSGALAKYSHNFSSLSQHVRYESGQACKGKICEALRKMKKDIAHFPFGLWTRTISLRKSKMSVLEIIYRWQVFENFEFKISREWTQFRILFSSVISKDTFKNSEKLFRNVAIRFQK